MKIIVHYPKTEEGKQELARRVASVHADAVLSRIKSLDCPDQQKLALIDAIIEDIRAQAADKAEGKGSSSSKTQPDGLAK